jgi:hypothetical protein
MPRSRRGSSGRYDDRLLQIIASTNHYILWSALASTTRSGGVLRECSYTYESRQPPERAIPHIARGLLSKRGRRQYQPVRSAGRGKQGRLYRAQPGARKLRTDEFFAAACFPRFGASTATVLIGSASGEAARRPTSVSMVGTSMSRRIAQITNFTAQWRWLTVVAVVVIATGAVMTFVRSRRRPHVATLPSSLFARRRPSPTGGEPSSAHGPGRGPVVQLADAPPPPPAGPIAVADDHPLPPPTENGPFRAPLPPRPDDLIVTIDLTELELEQAVDGDEGVVDLSSGEDLAALPADPWA